MTSKKRIRLSSAFVACVITTVCVGNFARVAYYDTDIRARDSFRILDKPDWFNSQTEKSGARAKSLDIVENATVPNTVYLLWCGSGRHFEFKNYLSVLSIIRYIEPDNIIMIYNETLPAIDEFHYSTWLSDIEHSFPFFVKKKVPHACSGTTYLDQILRSEGAIYVHENAVITRRLIGYNIYKSLTGTGGMNRTVLRMISGGYLARRNRATESPSAVHSCQLVSTVSASLDDSAVCIVLDDIRVSPKDIWDTDSEAARLLRNVAYGKPDIARPVPNYDSLIPNIAHVVWIGGGFMNFNFLLTVLSLMHVANVDSVYIHGEAPHGIYWDLIKDDRRVKVKHRTFVGRVYGGDEINETVHISDVVRVDVLHKYGGIYIDTDAIFVRPLPDEIRGYEAVASVDIHPAYKTPYPDVIQNGVMIAKPGAKFFQLSLQMMRNYYHKDLFWLGLRSAYKVKERHPTTLKIDPRLQVVCFSTFGKGFRCRPTWLPDYYRQSANHLKDLNWKADYFNVLHVTTPCPLAFQSHKLLLNSTGVFADIGRFIVERSGMLDLFRKLP